MRLIEKHVAEPSPDHHAERGPGEEVIDLERRGDGRLGRGEPAQQAPADEEAEDIGERIPADGEGAETHHHRIEAREEEDGEHGGPSQR